MAYRWEDLAARARSLSARLLSGSQLRILAAAPSLASLSTEIETAGFPAPHGGEEVAASDLELAIRRRTADYLALLAWWAGDRATGPLLVLYGEEDLRSLRALLRGAAQGASAEARLSGLLPTPALPERALEVLGSLTSTREVALLLRSWQHPFAAFLLPEARRPEPDLFRLELSLSRAFLASAISGAGRRAGFLEETAADLVDLENAKTLLMLAARQQDIGPGDCFLRGGRRLTELAFTRLAVEGDRDQAASWLEEKFGASPYRGVFKRLSADLPILEETLLQLRLREARRAARREPVGPAPVLAFALALRVENLDLRRVIWAVAMGAPRAELESQLLIPEAQR